MARRRRRPDEPERDAVVLVDKPAGPTSHDVVQTIRRASGQSRVGHTGTLDPAATGVLVICLGRATRLVRFLQAGTKTYAARMVLGIETTSQDADGEVVARIDASHVDERTFCEALTGFQGPIRQIPPMVSAVKVGGTRLHELARRGETVDREAREVIVHALVLDRFDATTEPAHPEVSFLVTCSAGTYVRTLAHDVGASLGVGGSLRSLRRVANGPFTVEESHPPEVLVAAAADGRLDDHALTSFDDHVLTSFHDHVLTSFDDLVLAPLDAIRRVLPTEEVVDRDEAVRLAQGGALPARGVDGPVALLHDGRLLAIHADRDGRSRAELVWTRPEEL